MAKSDELLSVIQDDICKSLLQCSRTDSLSVLSLTLRAVFNLFLHFRKHLKVQLEVFFTSVHLRIAAHDAASHEQRELALESLLEFCREPELMLELYENYDCDVRCTNLFETLVKFLVTHAFPPDAVQGISGGFNALHRLALSGLLSILHSIAVRCVQSQGRFRAGSDPSNNAGASGGARGGGTEDAAAAAASAAAASTQAAKELQRKKEQKRRMALAARTFNSEPSKSMGALQSLGLVSSPPTPESMAEFLRHTAGLDLRLVGEYLSKRHDFNGQVRKAFMTNFHFEGMGLVEGLRTVLGTFRLPGEAQLIERLMESFAEIYFASQVPIVDGAEKTQDPLKMPRWIPREKQGDGDDGGAGGGGGGGGPEEGAGEAPTRVRMASSDTIFVLSYSIIMLNTDLHSVRVKNKMKIEEFVRNNRGIDGGKDLPKYFLEDIFEAIRDDEIRLHGETGADETIVDDFFWEGVLRRGESIAEFSATERLLSESPPDDTERDMLQVIMDCETLPKLQLCFESVTDAAVASQAMAGFYDLVRINSYFGQIDAVNSLVRVMCQYFLRFSESGVLPMRAQIALSGTSEFVTQHAQHFGDQEWRMLFEVLLQLWALDLLPAHFVELDDFSGPDGKPLASSCDLKPPFAAPAGVPCETSTAATTPGGSSTGKVLVRPNLERAESTDGFLESLTRWFEDETRDEEDNDDALNSSLLSSASERSITGGEKSKRAAESDMLPVEATDPATIHQQVKQFVSKCSIVESFTSAGFARLSAESLQIVVRALVHLSRPSSWSGNTPSGSPSAGADAATAAASSTAPAPGTPTPELQTTLRAFLGVEAVAWHEVADPVVGLELLTNISCTSMGPGQSVSQIWPLVSTHFERLLQHVRAGGGANERQFIERLIVNTLRLCIRLIGEAELVPTLLTLIQHLSSLPAELFAQYSERIACGVLVLLQETSLPHSGLRTVFKLLKRISEMPANTGACSAGLECLSYWLSDDAELARLLSLQQFPEMLATLEAFAIQSSTAASSTALGHLSSLVPQLARGSRSLPQTTCQWQSLWTPTLHVLADIAKGGAQKSSAQAFVYLQRLLLERGTELSVPWEELPFDSWKECLEQVLLPLLQASPDARGAVVEAAATGSRQASAAQLLCNVVLTHMPEWLRESPEGFAVLFLRLLHVLVSEVSSATHAREPLEHSLKNLMLVISMDPAFQELPSPTRGEPLLTAAWAVVSPSLPDLQREVALILDPSAAMAAAEAECAAPAQAP
eukprot:TRINITY_DN4392_c1_g1_i2.p1 TRINITY_DN4392_c1_g1~~TRINITY_DN4392_c1_g1_i2.p1  ORF type:complete len:1299 (-),score=328.84 TRINITY_DN4392_c1_g1_i2:23-3781(-)